MARSGPLRARFKRVISRMTDSVKLWAFSERRSVARIGALQSDLRARTRITALRHLQPPFPAPTNIAGPACAGEELEHIRAAQQTHHLAALDHRHAPDALADEQAGRFVNASVFADGDDVRAHDVARHLALLGEDVDL